jgi:NAD(P)-dependent dehydrogenase (short-subunit alcohol dehydrogenase family)
VPRPARAAANAVRLAQEGADIIASDVDVRDYVAPKAAVDEGVQELGRLDIAVANAGKH